MGRPPIRKRVIAPGERWRLRKLLRQEERKVGRKADQAGNLEKLNRRQAEPPVRNVRYATPAADIPADALPGRADPDPLIAAYQARGLKFPDWAYRRRREGTTPPPSVPFIGRRYGRWDGVLVYASAENLADYERNPDRDHPPYFADGRVWNRHRAAFATDPGSGFFPNVHMSPFNDGSLLVAVHYYLMREHGEEVCDPADLLESIAAANFCKFSAAGVVNTDYAGNSQMVAPSIPYVREDLRHLRPRVIQLPKTIYRHRAVSEMIEALAPGAILCPLYQFNPGVVQRNLKHLAERAEHLRHELEGTHLATWISKLRGYGRNSPYRYLIHMDEELGWPPYKRHA